MADNTLVLKFDKETTLPLLEGLGKSAYAIAVAHGFKGSEQEWLESLRGPQGIQGIQGIQGEPGRIGNPGPKGEPGSAEKSAQFLKEHGIWLEDTSVDTVLKKIIQLSNCYSNYVPKGLEFVQPKAGATYIDFTGEPHFKLSINNGKKQEFQSDNMRVAIDSTMQGTITVNYYNLVDKLVNTQQITLTQINGDIAYDMGRLVSINNLSLAGHENDFTELAGKVAIYKKGVKFTPTALSVKNTEGQGPEMALDILLEQFISTTAQDYYEVDLSKLPSNNLAFPNELSATLVQYYPNAIVKVNKRNVIGNSDTIKINGDDNHSIKINGSDLVETHRGSKYTYSFATDSITAD